MKRRVLPVVISLVLVLGILGAIGAVKASQIGAMIEAGESYRPPAIGVTTDAVRAESWESATTAIGTAVATQAIALATEVPGTVRTLRIESGASVTRGQVLLTLDDSIERAQLASARAEAELARLTLGRYQSLAGRDALAQAELDTARARLTQAEASVTQLQATIAKRTIRAPFAGRLGIREVDLGEVVQPGTPLVSLQALDPIYVDFRLPERAVSALSPGYVIRATSEVFPGETLEGRIETIDPRVDATTRSVLVRAVVANADERIRPGMFLDVEAVQPSRRELLAIPSSSVIYAPYGDSVYVVRAEDERLTAEQRFVRLGERRGDLVEVIEGLESGQRVVTTGAFKLQNGVEIREENEVAPAEARVDPRPENR
ncbi:MAG: efflux RND transporter periplasmic adaptor subunit [Sandaracinus sp.]|nr:efflux RND transporter periplasmic adaptor subunit [Sandaracinus sp.]MCB9625361.1 efflux RND transporter periplasmic adaptor subunit [Sandaracinus sp.]